MHAANAAAAARRANEVVMSPRVPPVHRLVGREACRSGPTGAAGWLPSSPMHRRAGLIVLLLALAGSPAEGAVASTAKCPRELATRQDRRGSWICRTVDGRRAWRAVPQPVVTNRLPFDPAPPNGTSDELLQQLVDDVSALWNCNSGIMDACARSVWGRRDPWNLPRAGRSEDYDRPWVALWRKYELAGVSIGHEDGPFTAAHPRGAPQLSFFYLATIGGRNFGLEISSADDVVFTDPRTWFVPNCPACRGYVVVPLP